MFSNNSIFVDCDQVCRVCLSGTVELQHIFGQNENNAIAKILMNLTSISVSPRRRLCTAPWFHFSICLQLDSGRWWNATENMHTLRASSEQCTLFHFEVQRDGSDAEATFVCDKDQPRCLANRDYWLRCQRWQRQQGLWHRIVATGWMRRDSRCIRRTRAAEHNQQPNCCVWMW